MLIALAACGSEPPRVEPPSTPTRATPATDNSDVIAPTPQRAGDPKKGWEALVGEGYVGCGVPRSLWDRWGGRVPTKYRLERSRGADLPYFMNQTKIDGVEVVSASCLGCHATLLRGKLVVGLGEVSMDYNVEASSGLAMAGMFVNDTERAHLAKLAGRVKAVERVKTTTAGANPADHIAAVLFAHRDMKTLAWSDEPLIPFVDEPAIPVDVPAWWLLKKKAAMFHTGAGRGDQARIMMTASVLCVDDVATARAIDGYFPDIRAYLMTIEPPKYPGTIDKAMADEGKRVFEGKCAGCHGTYGADGKYKSRVIALSKIGTDPMLAHHAGQFAERFTEWFNGSFYGELARLEPGAGYVPPPLDGVWATAPYLHNGSVPNLQALLDSSQRHARTAIVRGDDAYDLDAVGWPNTPAPVDAPARWVYDTAVRGYGNSGHVFGDQLSATDRKAVIEYLKTL